MNCIGKNGGARGRKNRSGLLQERNAMLLNPSKKWWRQSLKFFKYLPQSARKVIKLRRIESFLEEIKISKFF